MPVCKKVKLSRFCLLVFFAFLYSIPWVFGIVHNPMESERNALQSASCQNWKERKGSVDFREETFGDLQICMCVLSKINLGKGHTCIIPVSIFDSTCHIYSLYTQHLNENLTLGWGTFRGFKMLQHTKQTEAGPLCWCVFIPAHVTWTVISRFTLAHTVQCY